jgi:hypothetical protein
MTTSTGNPADRGNTAARVGGRQEGPTMAASKSTTSTTPHVPTELRARYDAATITEAQVAAYWQAQDSGALLGGVGYPIAAIDRWHPDAARRLIGAKDLPEYEHLIRLTKARKDHDKAAKAARCRVEKHAPCEFCGRREPSGPPIYTPTGTRRRGCVTCAPLFAAILGEELAAAAGQVEGIDVEAVMRATAQAEAVAYVTEREAAWARLTADPNPLPPAA